jgi:hypothetical protein
MDSDVRIVIRESLEPRKREPLVAAFNPSVDRDITLTPKRSSRKSKRKGCIKNSWVVMPQDFGDLQILAIPGRLAALFGSAVQPGILGGLKAMRASSRNIHLRSHYGLSEVLTHSYMMEPR